MVPMAPPPPMEEPWALSNNARPSVGGISPSFVSRAPPLFPLREMELTKKLRVVGLAADGESLSGKVSCSVAGCYSGMRSLSLQLRSKGLSIMFSTMTDAGVYPML